MRSPTRRDSYSDSTDNDELEEAFGQARDLSVYQRPTERLDQYENANLDDTVRSAYYSPGQSMSRPEVNRRSVIQYYVTFVYTADCMGVIDIRQNKLKITDLRYLNA